MDVKTVPSELLCIDSRWHRHFQCSWKYVVRKRNTNGECWPVRAWLGFYCVSKSFERTSVPSLVALFILWNAAYARKGSSEY